MIKLLILSLLTFNAHAVNTASPIGAAKIQEYGSGFRNYVKNPSGFRNTESTATSSAAIARDTDSGDQLDGISSFTCDASAQNGYCEWTLDTIAEGDKTGSCEFKGSFKGDGSLYKAQIMESSTVVNTTSVLGNQSDWYEFSVNAPCGSTRTVRITQTESGTAPSINVGRMYYGRSTNIGTVSQASLYATATQLAASGCNYSESTSTGENDYITLGTGSGCNAWTTTGNITPVGTNSHQMTITNLPPGQYEIGIVGAMYTNTNSQVCNWRFNDGTTSFGYGSTYVSGAQAFGIPPTGVISYTQAQSSVTFRVQAADTAAGQCYIANETAGRSVIWTIKRFPTSSETVVRSENAWWKVDANISGANPDLGSADVSSYSPIENGSLTLTNNSGTGNITSQIGCSSTNSPSGTTCSVGNESVAIAFTPLGSFPQDVLACVSFGHFLSTGASGNIDATFQLVETATNAQTILQEGKSRISSNIITQNIATSNPLRVCGNFTFTSGGQKMLRLMYEQDNVATVSTNVIVADASSLLGQRDIHWEVYPLNASKPATTYAGSVTSNSSGLERTERAEINCDASSSITSQSGSWLSSVGNRSGTSCAITIASGIFSSAPTCQFTVKSATPQATSVVMTSATAGTVYAASADYDGYFSCYMAR